MSLKIYQKAILAAKIALILVLFFFKADIVGMQVTVSVRAVISWKNVEMWKITFSCFALCIIL